MPTQDAARILIVEDDAQIRRFVRMALIAEGFEVCEAETRQRGLIDAGTRRPDLIILDLGLPDGDGIDLIVDLRSWSQMPIVILSARGSEEEKVRALDAGADDYLVKPFSTAELLARIRAHLRRRAQQANKGDAIVEFGSVRMDLVRRTVSRGGLDLHLSPIEFRLLVCLTSSPDCVLTHRQLLKAVWGPAHTEHTHYVRVYMGHLRKKLEDDPSRPRHLRTEAGIGYRFVS